MKTYFLCLHLGESEKRYISEVGKNCDIQIVLLKFINKKFTVYFRVQFVYLPV